MVEVISKQIAKKDQGKKGFGGEKKVKYQVQGDLKTIQVKPQV